MLRQKCSAVAEKLIAILGRGEKVHKISVDGRIPACPGGLNLQGVNQ
jgi:hypothetical protein